MMVGKKKKYRPRATFEKDGFSQEFNCRICGSENSQAVVEKILDWEFGVPGEYNYHRCMACNNVQLHPFPALAELKKAYPENYTAHLGSPDSRGLLYSLLYKVNHYFFSRKLAGKIPRDARVLDAGCGTGQLLLQLKSLGATELNGVDFSPQACEIARKQGVKAFEGTYLEYPRKDNSIDAVFMMNYLEHVEHPMQELVKTHELLTEGGWLVGECPNFGSFDQQLFGRFWGGNHVPRHTFQYSARHLRKMLYNAGFTQIKIRQELNPSILAISIQNYLQRNQIDLANNPGLPHGRMKGFSLLMLGMLPINIIFSIFGKSGIMTFYARK